MNGIKFLREDTIRTVKDLKEFLNQFDENREVLFQMVDGEYDRVGYIDSYSDEHSEFEKKYYLRNEHNDALLIVCYSDYVSSQF